MGNPKLAARSNEDSRPDRDLARCLDRIAGTYRAGSLDSDPVGVVRELSGRAEIEVGGLIAASLALGRASLIRARTREVFDRLDGRPAAVIAEASPRELARRLAGFRHRFFGEEDLLALLVAAGRILRGGNGLGAAWPLDVPFETAANRFGAAFRGAQGRAGGRRATIPLVPVPSGGSPCKRTMMFLRWMVRPDDGIDFGFWDFIPPSDLVIPLDTHVFRIARLLGLTRLKNPSWRAALAITSSLRRFAPLDPVRYDFALSRIGIVEGCLGRRTEVCARCGLAAVCTAPGRH